MIFISHKPIDIESTRAFDLFTRENYEKYIEINQDSLNDSDPVAWFTASIQQRQSIINMNERSGKFVLIKLLRSSSSSSDYEVTTGGGENIDVQYIGFIGYEGSRCFAKGNLC
jgi:hypothetical protein